MRVEDSTAGGERDSSRNQLPRSGGVRCTGSGVRARSRGSNLARCDDRGTPLTEMAVESTVSLGLRPEGITATAGTPLKRRRELALTAGVLGVYAGLALAAYWPILPGSSARIPACACGDPSFQTWLLGWVPYALVHGHNPLFSSWTNYPVGVNLAQNTDMPLLGLISAPITLLISPVASYNLLLWLSFPVSAIAMYAVVRRWTGSRLAGFCAGLVYGFSAYVIGQGIGHVMLSFVPLPPLYFYQLHKLLVRREGNPYWEGLLLGVIAVAQYFISAEILVSCILLSAIGLVVYAVAERRHLSRLDVYYALRGLGVGFALLAVCAVYAAWFAVFGPQHFTGPAHGVNGPYHGVALGPVLPNADYRLGFPGLSRYGHLLDPVENGQYLGIPLLLLATLFVVWFRKHRGILLACVLAVAAYVLSLGDFLGVLTLNGSVPLPFIFIAHVPLLNNLLPERLSLYTQLFVAVIIGLGIGELARPAHGLDQHVINGRAASWQPTARRYAAVGLGALAVVTLIPKWPDASYPSNVPVFFRSSLVKQIPVGSVVLTYPFPNYPVNQAMTWQSVSGMRFKEMGTYALLPGPGGQPTNSPTLLSPPAVQEYLTYEELMPGTYPKPVVSNAQLVEDIRAYISAYKVGTVVVDLTDPTVLHVPAVLSMFTRALGPPRRSGGVALWAGLNR